MGKKKTKTVVGKKNTVIKAIPKTLYKTILSIKLEMERKEAKNKKPRKITLLAAGLELNRRVKK